VSNYILLPVHDRDIQAAKQQRKERDALYGNRYAERKGHERWVGDLGEILFDRWARGQITDLQYHNELEAAGKADFTLTGRTVGVKTVKRQVGMRPYYTAQVTAAHASAEPVDQFFFCSYEYPKQVVWLLGGATVARYLRHATHYGPGEKVHAGYTVPKDHSIYNAPVNILVPPDLWIHTLSWPCDPVLDTALDF